MNVPQRRASHFVRGDIFAIGSQDFNPQVVKGKRFRVMQSSRMDLP